jgi:hypothetical protein
MGVNCANGKYKLLLWVYCQRSIVLQQLMFERALVVMRANYLLVAL